MNGRRTLLVALGAGAFFPCLVLSQSKQAPVLIGWLHAGSRKETLHHLAAFKEGMAALGWKEGRDFVLEEQWANSRMEQLQPLAEALAAKKPALIVASPSNAASAAAGAAPKTPVVLGVGDPLTSRLVTSLARPGG